MSFNGKIKPKINIYGNNYKTKDGTCIRDYIHVSDIAKIHFLVLKKINRKKNLLYLNCGYGKGISVLEAINEFQKQILEKNLKLILKEEEKVIWKKLLQITQK